MRLDQELNLVGMMYEVRTGILRAMLFDHRGAQEVESIAATIHFRDGRGPETIRVGRPTDREEDSSDA